MTDAEFAEQERRAGMAAAGIDVGAVDGLALVNEIKRLRNEAKLLREEIAEYDRMTCTVRREGDAP